MAEAAPRSAEVATSIPSVEPTRDVKGPYRNLDLKHPDAECCYLKWIYVTFTSIGTVTVQAQLSINNTPLPDASAWKIVANGIHGGAAFFTTEPLHTNDVIKVGSSMPFTWTGTFDARHFNDIENGTATHFGHRFL
jgi:hypothetical protein